MSDFPPKPCEITNSGAAITLDGIIDSSRSVPQTEATPSMNNNIIEGSRQTLYPTISTERKQLAFLFDVYIPNRLDIVRAEWKIHEMPYPVPDELERNLKQFAQASFNWASGMSARVGLAILIVQCKLSFNQAFFPHIPNTTTAGNQSVGAIDPANNLLHNAPCIRTLPDRDLSVQIRDHDNVDIIVAGRADWVFAYGSQDDVSRFFGAIVVKRREHIFAGEDQLLAHLAIIRQHRIQANANSCEVGGFYTDGLQYIFMMISGEGNILSSRLYNVYRPGELETIFNFVLTILELGVCCLDDEVENHQKEGLDTEMGTCELPEEMDEDLE